MTGGVDSWRAPRVGAQTMRSGRLSFGKYQVLARLGQGGMGHVYLAMHVGPGGVQKIIVIKQLREDFASSVAARAMFLDEARISTRLNHPNIVQTNEVVDDEEDLYLVMEFLDGQPLSRILDPAHMGTLPLASKLQIIVEALDGMHYAHELKDYDGSPLNIVHRDISPQNIFVTYTGHVKVFDFGVAKAADAKTVTESGVFQGKVRYASPEQALCTPVDRRADVFGIGTILWEILTGRRLWQDQADASVLLARSLRANPRAYARRSRRIPPRARRDLLQGARDRSLCALRDGSRAPKRAPGLPPDRRRRDGHGPCPLGRVRRGAAAPPRNHRRAGEGGARSLGGRVDRPQHSPDRSGVDGTHREVGAGGALRRVQNGNVAAPSGTSRSRIVTLALIAVLALVGGTALLVPSSRRPAPVSASANARRSRSLEPAGNTAERPLHARRESARREPL